jgi:hypothetical protein
MDDGLFLDRGECPKCHGDADIYECWNCGGEGYSEHDCLDDTCCCLHPYNNVRCDICRGKGSYSVCLGECRKSNP